MVINGNKGNEQRETFVSQQREFSKKSVKLPPNAKFVEKILPGVKLPLRRLSAARKLADGLAPYT